MTPDALDSESQRDAGGASDRYASDYHAPVLWKAVVDGLITDRNGTYVDATLGGGGHAAAMLDALSDNALVLGVDRDDRARAEVEKRLDEAIRGGRLNILAGDFADLSRHLEDAGVDAVHGVLLDLGVSSRQVDDRERGFSYLKVGALDMRMDVSQKVTASTVVNESSEAELTRILREYGEEPKAARIARAIRADRPLKTTDELASVVRACVPQRDHLKSLSRVFQAIRIAVNREIEALEAVLHAATRVVRTGGRLAVISYHSLEDRRVKRFIRFGNFEGKPVTDVYGNVLSPWRPVTRRPIVPGAREVAANPRARSARLRIGERTGEVAPE